MCATASASDRRTGEAGRAFQLPLSVRSGGTQYRRRPTCVGKGHHRPRNAMLSRLPSRSGRAAVAGSARTCKRCKGASHICSHRYYIIILYLTTRNGRQPYRRVVVVTNSKPRLIYGGFPVLNSFMMFARTTVERSRPTISELQMDLTIDTDRLGYKCSSEGFWYVFWRTPSQLVKFLFRVRD